METIKLSTNLIGLNGLTTYHGYLSSEILLNEDLIDEDFKERYIDFNSEYYCQYFDNIQYMEDLCNQLNHLTYLLIDQYSECGIYIDQIDCLDYDSPREYNFRGDHFHLDFMVENWERFELECRMFLEGKRDQFNNFLKDNYSSRDGFISFGSNNFNEWSKDFKEKNQIAIGAVFSFIHNGLNDVDQLYYSIMGGIEMYYYDYVDLKPLHDIENDIKLGLFVSGSTSGINQEIEARLLCKNLSLEFKQYYNFPIDEVNKLIQNKYGVEFDFSEEIQRSFNEIDSQTLKLF